MSTYIVSSGYVDNSRTIGTAYTVDKLDVYGFGNFTTVSSGGSLCVKSSGRTNQATVNSWGGLYIFSDGYASSNTINGGVMRVYRGGVASNNHIDSDGEVLIYEGASAIENYLSHTQVMQSSKAYMSSTKVRNGAILVAYGSVEDTSVSSGGSFSIAGNASSTWVYAHGTATVQDKGHAISTNLYPSGCMDVLSGGVATFTSIGTGATMRVRAGGHVTSTTVLSSTANMYVSGSGASAWYTTLRKGTLHVSDGGFVSYTSAVGAGAVAQIYSGGTAVSGLVQADGRMQINVGGSARGISVSSGGRVDNYGIASAIRVSSLGRMDVNDGGVGNTLYINDLGQLHVSGGGSALGGMTQGYVYVSEGGWVSGMTAFAGSDGIGRLDIKYSGLASDVIIKNHGILSVSGGTANVVNISSGGWAQVSAGGQMNLASVSSGGSLSVLDGGFASDTDILSSGLVTVFNTGSADNTTVNSSAVLNVLEGGIAQSTTVLDGGRITVSSGGTAITAEVSSGGKLWVSSGGTATDLTVSNGGCIEVDFDSSTAIEGTHNDSAFAGAGGLLSNMTIGANCRIKLGSGGTAAWTEVELNGFLRIKAGGKVTDQLTINPGAMVSADVGGIVDFDVAMFYPDEEFTIINDISLIQGTPTYTITVLDTQDSGVYRLAGGATGFDQTVKVLCDDTELGSLTVGNTATLAGLDYTLNLNDDLLTLTVGAPSPAVSGTAGDLNMDGRADIVMTIDQSSHPADGATGAWLILSDQTAAWGDLSTRNAGWEIFGTGKTAAGKNTDDVYIKSEGNIVGAWTTDDGGKVNGWETVGEFDSETQIVGLGDFNGNGQTDLLLRNNNGAVGCFFTDGRGWNYFQSLGEEWKFSAVGDLNGDGRDDVVLKHDAGFAGSWLTQEDGTMAWADLDTLEDGFEIVGTGDFDGDGTDDVLLKKDNYYGAWLVNNGNAVGWFGLGDLGNVAVEQIADFNADGVDDLRIRTAAGDIGAQLVMAADSLDWHYYGSVGEEWKTGLAALN